MKRGGSEPLDRVVNLCFHGVGTPERHLEPGEAQFWLEISQFEEMLTVIRRDSSLRLTFDDGNASDATLALPRLLGSGLVASFFVVADRLGKRGSLGLEDVRVLVRAGMTIGTHGMRHRSWRSLDDEALDEELIEARQRIADAAGKPIDQAACPFGAYDRRVLAALRRSAFKRVYTVDGGSATVGSWLQSRYTVKRTDTPQWIEQLGERTSDGPIGATIRTMKSTLKRWR
jgi:peptidoglycan/xylan/chitin deacetylase (PgdA/CDA1 family)